MKKIFFINCIFVLLLLFLIEMSIRVFSDITPQGISKGIIDEQSLKPKFNFPNILNGKLFGKNVFTNKYGFRVENQSESLYHENNENIYFVGGSVTFGSGVNQSKTFSGILNKNYPNLNIHNASVVGSNLENNFYIINNKISKKKLGKIFVNFSLDDISVYEKEDKNSNNKQVNVEESFYSVITKKIKNNEFFLKINNLIRSKSVTYVLIKALFLNSEKNYYYHALNSFKIEKNLEYLNTNLILISSENKEIKSKIIFLIIPYSYQIKDENCSKRDIAEKIIDSSLKKMNFKILKLKKVFCEDNNKDKIYLGHDPAHLSKYGHNLIANFLKKEM